MNSIKPRIICHEDDVDMCTVLSLLLESHGHEVTVAQTWLEAVGALKLMQFDFILTNLHFGGQPRHIEQIRTLAPTPPLTVLSGLVHPELIDDALASGAQHIFRKP